MSKRRSTSKRYRSSCWRFQGVRLRPLCGNVEGTDFIGIANETARTRKMDTFTITEITTIRASLGCVGRIHEDQAHSSSFRLVSDELLERVEVPASDHAIESASLVGATPADTRKVLHCQERIGLFCKGDYLLGNDVVVIPLEAKFSAGQPFQGALRTFRASALQRCFGTRKQFTLAVEGATGEGHTVAESGDALNTQIHTERLNTARCRSCQFDSEVEIEVPFAVHAEVAAAGCPVSEKAALIVADGQGDMAATKDGRDRNRLRYRNVSGERLVNSRTLRTEAHDIAFDKTSGYPMCRRYRIHRSQPVPNFECFVDTVLYGKTVPEPGFFRISQCIVTRIRKSLQGGDQGKTIFRRDIHAAFDGLNHTSILLERNRS